MNTKTSAYCPECHKAVSFEIQKEERLGLIKGDKYPYMRMVARCTHCNEELDVYNDENLKILYDAYRETHDLISLEKIREIPEIYNIGKRPLSLLLGWGEITFSRYYDGYLPTKQYSDILKRLYNDPEYYRTTLEEGKKAVNEITYKKSKIALQELFSFIPTPIINVAAYIIKRKHDLTSYRIQKLLYYSQGFSFVFCKSPLFIDLAEAWVHGPVYREVFYKYRDNSIDEVFSEFLTDIDKEFIDCVLESFGRYDGDTLEGFTHKEAPWLDTRGNLASDIHSERVIPIEAIETYFFNIKNRFGMESMHDMKKYAQHMFQQL